MNCSLHNESKTFLSNYVTDLPNWKDLNDELVMDVGCGIGTTAMAIVDLFPNVRQVVGIDISEHRLRLAELYNAHPKIVYQRRDITVRESIDQWIGEMDKAVSVFCFNCLKSLEDVEHGYKNLYRLLKPGGEAVILQSLRSGYYGFLYEIGNTLKWRDYFKGLHVKIPISHFDNSSAVLYGNMLSEIGFDVEDCHEEVNVYGRTFRSDEECKNSLYNYGLYDNIIPEDKRAEFKEDMFRVYLKNNGRNDKGNVMLEHTTLSAFVRKPDLNRRYCMLQKDLA